MPVRQRKQVKAWTLNKRNLLNLRNLRLKKMKNTFYITIILILIIPSLVLSQSITNVRFHQTDEDQVVITYDITSADGRAFEVELWLSQDGGRSFVMQPMSVSGDVGEKVKGGQGKRIVWDVLSDIRKLEGSLFVFKVIAMAKEMGDKSPGPITGMVFVRIPEGSFMMGSPSNEKGRYKSEGPQHRVTINSFYMQTTEVTQKQWREVMGNNPSNLKGDNLPVGNVSWNDCQEFIKKLNRRDPGKGYRLPSEAEWEYACRAETTTPFNTGSTIGNGPKGLARRKTTSVGSFAPNKWGLYDMHGNVYEWCEDWYHDSYRGSPSNGSAWVSPSGDRRLLRGGSWRSDPRVLPFCSSRRVRPGYPIQHHRFSFVVWRFFQSLILDSVF